MRLDVSTRRFLALGIPLLAGSAGCAEREAPQPEPVEQERPDRTTGETRATIAPRGEPPAISRSGPEVPVNLPPGFTLYPGAKAISNTIVARRGKERMLMVFESPDPPAKVLTFYRLQAAKTGAQVTLDLGGEDRASLGGTLRSGESFALTVRRGKATRAELAFE